MRPGAASLRTTPLMTLCLSAFGRVALVEGEAERAALLVGAAGGLRRRAGVRPWPMLRRPETKRIDEGPRGPRQPRLRPGVCRRVRAYPAGPRGLSPARSRPAPSLARREARLRRTRYRKESPPGRRQPRSSGGVFGPCRCSSAQRAGSDSTPRRRTEFLTAVSRVRAFWRHRHAPLPTDAGGRPGSSPSRATTGATTPEAASFRDLRVVWLYLNNTLKVQAGLLGDRRKRKDQLALTSSCVMRPSHENSRRIP